MAVTKPSNARGTRDFGPLVMAKRNYIFDIIKAVFIKYGFLPIETPAIENLSTLTGKYGEEGDQLIFKILNSGNFLENVTSDTLTDGYKKATNLVSEKALRYDLTIPFARYVVSNRNDITFPFKRYQIQPVWRADKPQKGRYREFYQCDADVIGTTSLIAEAEIILMIIDVFNQLGVKDYAININHRCLLTAMADTVKAHGQEGTLAVAIDKLDKIGQEKVELELLKNGFTEENVELLKPFFNLKAESIATLLPKVGNAFGVGEAATQGLKDLETLQQHLLSMHGAEIPQLKLDVKLARGLSYYTGCIFEVTIADSGIGSVSGGGRYDNLTGLFGLDNVSGVGFSFGIDRLYDALETLQLFPNIAPAQAKVLVTNFDASLLPLALQTVQKIRANWIAADIYPDVTKLKKQLEYASKKGYPYVCIIGEQEAADNTYTLKNMSFSEQKTLFFDALIENML